MHISGHLELGLCLVNKEVATGQKKKKVFGDTESTCTTVLQDPYKCRD